MRINPGRQLKTLVSGAILLGAAHAHAEPAATRFATFMRVGPDRSYAANDEIPTRTAVDVAGCRNGWCQVRYGGGTGWVEQRMLVPASAIGPAVPPGPPAECVDFARTGWPRGGDATRLCLYAPAKPAGR